ncbi:MAG: PfkB family carbohydrate kinase [Bacteroidota bacterium]
MKNNIEAIFDSFEGMNVLIVGDVMIDRYMTGAVTRVSPEAPVPVVHLQQSETRLGGAANVALNVKALGATPYLCSIIGKDEKAEKLLELLGEEGLPVRGVVQSSNRRTTTKTRVIAGSQHLLRVDEEDVHELSPIEERDLMLVVRELLELKEFDAILFQDYNKGVLSFNIIRNIMLEAVKRDIPTAVDPKRNNFTAYQKVTLFKPNLKEVQDHLNFKISSEFVDLAKASEQIKSALNNKITLITLSEKGLFIDDGQDARIIATTPRSISDVCGAGDTVFSVAGLGLAAGLDSRAIATLSNLAGGQVCEHVGVVPVDRDQLKEEYIALLESQQGQPSDAENQS